MKKTPRSDAGCHPPQTSRSKPAGRILWIPLRDYSYRTEESYIEWAHRFILFHNKRHPENMGAAEINAFLTHLAIQRNVAASTQSQALSAVETLFHSCCPHQAYSPFLYAASLLCG